MYAFRNPSPNPHLAAQIYAFRDRFDRVVQNVERVVVGKDEIVRKALLTMIARGHILFRDLPGTGKTTLARALAASIACDFRRIQFTPDLLPMDVTGASVLDLHRKALEFSRGPVFTHLLLADEINRATPKTQSALLEVMAEGQVTVEGTTHRLEPPFLVLATMNPLDHEGTYPLPAAQLDRFAVQLSLGFPSIDAEIRMLDVHLSAVVEESKPVVDRRTFLEWQQMVPGVYVSDALKRYAVHLANAVRCDARALAPPSPRATLTLVRVAQAHALCAGRDFLLPEDVGAMAADVLAHRVVIAGERSSRSFIEEVLRTVDAHP